MRPRELALGFATLRFASRKRHRSAVAGRQVDASLVEIRREHPAARGGEQLDRDLPDEAKAFGLIDHVVVKRPAALGDQDGEKPEGEKKD